MKQKLPLLLLLLLAVWGARAQAPTWQSALSSAAVDVRAVATNAAGDVFVTGSYTGTVTFGPNTLNSSGDADMFVAKWAAGATTWAWAASGGGGTPGDAGDANDMGNAIAVNGNRVYVAGQFRSAFASFGSSTLSNGGLNDMFVARFTDNNTSVATVGARGSSNAAASDLAYGLAVNPTNGNVYVTGYFGGSASLTATISGTALTSAGSADVYVAKYLDNGGGLTNGGATRAGGTSSEVATCLALSGNTLYVGGRFNSGTSVFSSSSLTNNGGSAMFVARFTDTNPTAVGAVTTNNAVSGGGSDGTEGVQGIAVNGSSVYVTGRMSSTTATIAGSTLTNATPLAFDLFVAKYTDNGTALANGYAVRDGGTGNENSSPFGSAGIAVNGTSVYVTGDFDASATIAGTALTNLGGTDVYVAKYTDTGSTLTGGGALRGGGTGDDASYGIAVTSTQGVVGGTTTTPSNFGTALTTGSSFAARLSFGVPPTVTTTAASSITANSAVLGGNVTADGGATVTDRGVVYSSTATTPAIGGGGVTQAANGTGTGTFSATISGLTPSTIYYVRAYAINSAGTSYGSVQTFTTQAIAMATAQNVTVNLAANGTATLNASSVNNGSTGSGTLTYTIQKIVYGKVSENQSLTLTTPSGVNFTAIRFASYGTPNDNGNGNYSLGNCNAANSVAAATSAYVGRSSGTMYASNTDTRNTPVLGDPCSGTPKSLAVQAGYSADAASLTYDCTEANKTQYVLLTVTDGNNSTSTSVAQVTVNPPPTASFTLNPVSGTAGTNVTVTGTNLSGAMGLTVNGTAATISNLTATGFSFVVPTGATSGNVVLTLPCGQTPSVAFTVQTAAPVVLTPANGSLVNTATPTYSGTAPAGSTVAVYIDGNTTPIGTTTATGGTWSLAQPAALSQGSHTAYATAQSPGTAVSANSNTNTFTVDSVRPTVGISSTAGTSGSTTGTTPIPFTVTFSESVTGFVLGDVSVSNGTASGFSGAGTTYTFSVTPTTPGTATTVSVPANVAQDQAGNLNLAAPAPYALTYNAPVTAVTWNGSLSTDWYTAGNWTPNQVPTASLDATVPASAPNQPAIGAGAANARSLTLNAGATLTQTGGTLDLRGNLTNNGTFQPTGGTVVLGTTFQSNGPNLLGSSAVRFWNLTVNSNGVLLSTSAGASVQHLLTLNGAFVTQGNPFTLESNATSTALVVNNAGGFVFGSATVQRYIDPSVNPGLGYRHYSSPVVSTTVADLATSTFAPVVNPQYNTVGNTVTPFPTVYGYDEGRIVGTNATTQGFDQGYFSPNALSDQLTVGRGYTVNIDAASKVDLNGALNNGTVGVGALARGSLANSGWHLLGNPYPAPLDWSVARTGLPTGVIDAVYVFKSSSQYAGVYQFYQNGFGTLPGGLIGSMQGFFVRVSQSVPAFNFLNSWRTTTYQNPAFNRITTDTRPSVQLELVSAQGARDAAFVYFEPGATAGLDDHYDAAKLPNTTGLNLASVAAGQNLAVNGLPPMGSTSLTVPLSIGLPATGTYTLHAAQLLNFAPGSQPLLRDLQLGTLTDLSLHPDYTFTMNAANNTPRFELVFGPAQVLSTASAALAAQVAVFPNPASKAVFVELPTALRRTAVTAGLVDALGREVVQRVLPAGLATHTLPLTGLATGVYSLRLQTEAGVVVKKLVVE